MSSRYRLVVFDWEGTIADSLGQVLHIVLEEAAKLGLGPMDLHSAKNYVELDLASALRKCFSHASTGKQEQLIKAVEQSIVSQPTEVFLVPGVLDFIKRLQQANISLAIATNKGQYSLTRALQTTHLDSIFRVTRCAGQVPAKPYPQMLSEIMDEMSTDAFHTLMIGDSSVDMEMAKELGVDAIGVDLYNQNELSLKAAGALEVFNDYKQLACFLELPT